MLAIPLAGALSELEWSGWNAVMLPGVQEHVPSALESATSEGAALRLLAALYDAGNLGTLPNEWWTRVGGWAASRIVKDWVMSDTSVCSSLLCLAVWSLLTATRLLLGR